jgi:hypothetical protein
MAENPMGELAYDLERRLLATLRKGDLARCEKRIATTLESLPKSPFQIATGLSFSNMPRAVAAYCDAFFQREAKRFPIAAAYAEMNGFDVNPQRWHFSLFAFAEYGGHTDYDWLADWQSEDDEKPLTLTGLERLQKVYAGPALKKPEFRDAAQLTSLLVVVKFQELINRAAEHMQHRHFPLLATAHDYDFIFEAPAPGKRKPGAARSQRGGKPTVAELIEKLQDPNVIVSARAAETLAAAGRRARSAIPVMIDLLQSSNPDIRGTTAAALGRMSPLPPEAVTALVGLLADPGKCSFEGQKVYPIRFRAAFALAQTAPDRTEIVPIIREALHYEKLAQARADAINVVCNLGTSARQFLPDLRAQIDDTDFHRKVLVQYALSRLDPDFRITNEKVREQVEMMRWIDELRESPSGARNDVRRK